MDVSGGAERLISELVRHEPGHQVLVYDGGESFYDLGQPLMRAQGILGALWWILTHKRRFDVVHLHLFPSIYFSMILGRSCVVHEHNTGNRRRAYQIFRPVEWLVYRRARAVIAISQAAADALVQWVGGLPRLCVLPNFVPDLAVGQPSEPAACIHDCQETRHEIRLLMVASLTPKKNHAFMLQVLAALPTAFVLHLVGEGPLRDELVRQAGELGVMDRIHFHGAERDVARHYRTADLCVLTSNWEGFGLVAIEAAQFGIPTVVPNVPGLRDFVPDKRFLIQEREPAVWAKRILELRSVASDDTVQSTYREAAKAFSLQAYLVKLDAAYA
ncbi:hypothetical protein JY96_16095 [Aquabacterium sp. NJ1]|uniref:glycosyltransferase n=1 Tax=Aquabacterium sp. NJ1 TaxID=1538295 RepID=UPI00052BA13F|nr:hypothetical protein JY96_16095 [Aquabacterium sp. NJ1]